jgi:carboxylesterase type B
MVEDVSRALRYVYDHIGEYGGDRNNITIVGQSAGNDFKLFCFLSVFSLLPLFVLC